MTNGYVDIHTHAPRPDIASPKMLGVHPWDAEKGVTLPHFEACDIVGETGLDYACEVDHKAQQRVFEAHLDAAKRLQKPVVLHVVRSFEDVMLTLRGYSLQGVVFHGFTGSEQQAKRCVERGYFLSFGERSLRSPKTRQVIATLPAENLFCETDDRAHPTIEQIYAEVAALRSTTIDKLKMQILSNYVKLFAKNG
ncbi:MAG: TatD family hydrolase [Alistipes sp.]|nr:TatD family hydrolase [Alistipes sp.]